MMGLHFQTGSNTKKSLTFASLRRTLRAVFEK